MHEGQALRVEHGPAGGASPGGAPAVDPVSQDRQADVGQVHPDLVLTAGVEVDLDPVEGDHRLAGAVDLAVKAALSAAAVADL